MLAAVEFDKEGRFLATGDRGGRVVVLESDGGKNGAHYKFHCEFQSHEEEFDYVRSLAIEERINKIKWLPPCNDSLFMLTTNDKAIKLWKIYNKKMVEAASFNLPPAMPSVDGLSMVRPAAKVESLRFPRLEIVEEFVISKLRREYAVDVHQFHINSLAVNSDKETFLSADNLRINLWNVNYADRAFNIVDTKPENMQDLVEVITAADFHPTNCHEFLFSNSKGGIRLADLRAKALCDKNAKLFTSPPDAESDKTFFADVTKSISDCKFIKGGRYMLSRDFMTLKIWDVNMESKPVDMIRIHEYLRPKLWDLYESENVYDVFECSSSSEGNFVTGTYNNYFHVYDMKAQTDTWVEASKVPLGVVPIKGANNMASSSTPNSKKKDNKGGRGMFGRKIKSKKSQSDDGTPQAPEIDVDTINYDNKILQVAWHPKDDVIAVASQNNLFVYSSV